jgi:hypothetical protein
MDVEQLLRQASLIDGVRSQHTRRDTYFPLDPNSVYPSFGDGDGREKSADMVKSKRSIPTV